MVRAFVLAVLTGALLAIPGGATARAGDEKKDDTPPPSAERIVSTLHSVRVSYDKDLTTTPLPEVLADLGTRFDLTFVIDKAAFEEPQALNDTRAENLGAPRLDGLALGAFLDVYFRGLAVPDVTYLVRDDRIEITTRKAAQKEVGLLEAIEEAGRTDDPTAVVRAKARLNLPLVSVVVGNKTLGAVLSDLSRVYGLNVVVEPGVRELTKTLLTERLLNVPADTALELLAGQAGLQVVRKGNTFRVTAGGAAP